MNRFQKKCLVASTGLHGFLLLLIVFGSAFFTSTEKPPQPLRINQYPTHLLDNALAGGGGNPNLARTDDRVRGDTLVPQPTAQAATPTPPQPRPPEPQPPRPKPEAKRPEPKQVEPPPKAVKATEPVKLTPVKTPEAKPRIDLNELKPLARTETDKNKARQEAESREAARQQRIADAQRQKLAQQIGKAADAMRLGFKSGTEVDVGGPGGAAYADYGAFVKAVYEDAWTVIQDLDDEEAVAAVRVTIARDGRVLSASIVQRSKSASLNKSVQRALDSVKRIPRPFPDSSKDSERTFNIKFNLKSKQLLG
jgi:TonB family protein